MAVEQLPADLYAVGTRTDRGLEAITLSIPPTPGRSIVKRIGRESGYASLGQQLAARGYDSAFIYGGRGYFDNMNAFFSGNGYRIVDQSSVPDKEMTFTNAWGMSAPPSIWPICAAMPTTQGCVSRCLVAMAWIIYA